MLQTRKINNEVCAVAFEPTEIKVRKCGKVYFGTEKDLVTIRDGKLIIHGDVAKEFGIEIYQTTSTEK